VELEGRAWGRGTPASAAAVTPAMLAEPKYRYDIRARLLTPPSFNTCVLLFANHKY
jgi:hypothetical protein